MKIKHIANIGGGQDGAIFNDYLFRFNTKGLCSVYNLKDIDTGACEPTELKAASSFTLDRADILAPHSNAVMFGAEYYSPEDEFPLLYTNIYNNYAKEENPLKGVCPVYRLQRNGDGFTTTLVQIIEIGFTEDANYWKSGEGDCDKRPYGNFTIDVDKGIYYGFTMRDQTDTTRYFAFDLPKLADGTADELYGVNRVVLTVDDIKEYFDCEYHRFIQGACTHKSKIYSVEGFSAEGDKPPVLRVINPADKKQELYVNLVDKGLTVEPELIDFSGDTCYYSDALGNLYIIDFE